jgi:chemotaxis protein CheX
MTKTMTQAMGSDSSKSVDVRRLEGFLDQATTEVFSTMMGVQCRPAPMEGHRGADDEMISAVIGLAGALSGSLILSTAGTTAMRIAEKLTGIAPDEVDAMVRDAIGEVSNMVTGAWKGFDPSLASGCLLSTPTVIAGTSYELFSQEAPVRIERGYRFEDHTFSLTVSWEMRG